MIQVGDQVFFVQDEFNILDFLGDPFVLHIQNAQKENFIVARDMILSKAFRGKCRLLSDPFWVTSIRDEGAWLACEKGKQPHFAVDLKLLVLADNQEAKSGIPLNIQVGDTIKSVEGTFGQIESIQDEFQSKKLQAEIADLEQKIQANGAEIMRIAIEQSNTR